MSINISIKFRIINLFQLHFQQRNKMNMEIKEIGSLIYDIQTNYINY